jgi:aconitate hydratase
MRAAADPEDVTLAYSRAQNNEVWNRLDAPRTPLFPWDDRSTYIRRPPFASHNVTSRLGTYRARPLLVLGDDITTDHISPAGQIPGGSDAAKYLIERGENPQDLNVFSSRRGNWEAMLRGLYTNRSIKNLLDTNLPPGTTIHAGSGAVLPLWLAAQLYSDENVPVVVVAGERYGTGSSRDWAAKGVWLLGARAVLAQSFERIHRSNLIGMGILPVRLPPDFSPLALNVEDWIEVNADASRLSPRAGIKIVVHRRDGSAAVIDAMAEIETSLEVDLLKTGGVLPFILRSRIH